MTDSKKPLNNFGKNKNNMILEKSRLFKDAATNAMDNELNFDKAIVASNDEYLSKLQDADTQEMDILRQNMDKAETPEEREAIRNRLDEMRKGRYEKDTENKRFYEAQQEKHRNFILKVLGTIAVSTGLIHTFKKPLSNWGAKFITKT